MTCWLKHCSVMVDMVQRISVFMICGSPYQNSCYIMEIIMSVTPHKKKSRILWIMPSCWKSWLLPFYLYIYIYNIYVHLTIDWFIQWISSYNLFVWLFISLFILLFCLLHNIFWCFQTVYMYISLTLNIDIWYKLYYR